MEITEEGKHFRLVHDNELPEILDVLEKYLPESIKFHQTIKTYLNERVWQFYFYVSKNWPEETVCLHFPGSTLTPNNKIYESVGIFCPSDKLEFLNLLETEDVLINWTEPLYLNFTHIDIIKSIETWYAKRWGIVDSLAGDIYICKSPPQPIVLESLPSDAEMRPLTHDNAKAIHDLYPASEVECIDVFEKLIDKLPGFGIFTIPEGELAAWMVQSYYGAMFSMQTRPEFRRKGYGIQLAQALTKLVLERGYIPFVAIRPENDASRSLYTKLGFERSFQTARVILRPKCNLNGGCGTTTTTTTNNDDNIDEGIEDTKDDNESNTHHNGGDSDNNGDQDNDGDGGGGCVDEVGNDEDVHAGFVNNDEGVDIFVEVEKA